MAVTENKYYPRKFRRGHNRSQLRHGMANRTPEYRSWKHARERCNNSNHHKFKDYGGRGIKFLFTSFESFLTHLGQRPLGTTLDRIENDGNYEPGNVRWATPKQQRQNQRAKRAHA